MTEDSMQYLDGGRAPNPKAWKGLIFLLVLVVLAIIIGLFVLQNRSAEGPLVIEERPIPISVMTQTVSFNSDFVSEEKFTGMVMPRRTSQLGFQSGGRIASLQADVGDRVNRGATLARLDVRSLEAQLASANAIVTEAEAAFSLAETTVERQRTLNEKGHVSIQRVDEAAAQANTAAARIQAAQANADTLKVQIDLARITAPFAGTVTARMADEGAIAGPGQPLFELVESDQLEATIGLTAKLADSLQIGQEYTLLSDQGPTRAKLRSVTGVINTSNRTVATVFDILEPDRVAAGAIVRIALEQRISEPGLWVPISALSERDRGLWALYVARRVDDEWVAEPGIVEIIHQESERVFVRGALRDGDRVILDGLQRITPNQPVTPVEMSSAGVVAGNG